MKYAMKFFVKFIWGFDSLLPCYLLGAPTLKLLQNWLRNFVFLWKVGALFTRSKEFTLFQGDILLNSNSNILLQFRLHNWM